jgi:hypothetical protein
MKKPAFLCYGLSGISVFSLQNEGPERIQYKCLVPIYVFQEMKRLFPKQNYNVLSPSSYTYVYTCARFIYFQDWPAYSAAGKLCGLIPGIYKLLTDT